MKKITLVFILVLTTFLLVSCKGKRDNMLGDENVFQDLISYCEKNTQKSEGIDGLYYEVNWTDVDSSETGAVDFIVCVYENKKITITGKSKFPYNEVIECDVVYTVSFIYGTNKDKKINYSVDYTMKMTRIKDAYNYYPYTLDEVKMSDSKAVFDVKKWTASCYYEVYTSSSNLVNFDDRNGTLRSVSIDSFTQLKRYFNDRANIALFLS